MTGAGVKGQVARGNLDPKEGRGNWDQTPWPRQHFKGI